MTVAGMLVSLLIVAAVTDFKRHQILNGTTYPGMVLGLILNTCGLGFLGSGWDGFWASVSGFLACSFIMLAAFVFFEMGGGDVKLMAMIGAALGVDAGIETLLWTFSLGFICGVSLVIWQVGIWNLVRRTCSHLKLMIQARGWIPLTSQERQPLERSLFLAPAALVATLIVLYPRYEHFFAWGKS